MPADPQFNSDLANDGTSRNHTEMMTFPENERPADGYPKRKKLPHHIPAWVTQGARHFITINALRRDAAPFMAAAIANSLLQNLLVYESMGKWHLWLSLVMPDHLHFIATFNLDYGVARSVAAWKGYQTKTLKIEFQNNYFEHRLRDEEEYRQKAAYIRENPVRKGLVVRAEDWPYRYER